ncbi:MAG: stage III sporulation protein AB [Clostridia bacterium]|nr:stage III sporulation protein AB [Clostridia bacterium]
MKGVGMALVTTALILAGFFAAELRRRQSKIRHGFLSLLEEMYFQIEHFSTEQERLFAQLSIKELERNFLPLLREELAKDPVLAWKRALDRFDKKGLFSPREEEGLLSLGEHFGLLSKKRQLEELDVAIDLMKGCVAKDEKSLQTDLRLYRMLGFTAGLGFLILEM